LKLSDKDLSDEQLIDLIALDNEEITDVLLERYKPLVKNVAKSMYILGSDYDDLIQEGMIGLLKAVRGFDKEREASFATFARICVSRQLYSYVKASKTKKNYPMNFYVSLYEQAGDTSGDSLVDSLEDIVFDNPEKAVIDEENVKAIEECIRTSLSPMERQVLELHLAGLGIEAIAECLGKSEKSVDNALQRGRTKVREFRRGNA